ncbi:hypothetical protein DEO72_LG7g3133 [Vigna unguiculata]|uniref:DUF4408 domain-containing protein n=1 Tax=Vigna unguiculata TaxID=3917 RepID=A0A4D6MKB3_VIGUN|nr:hypothetical protein DEO72_LG7g3133 [Vigna unguiculata]
MDQLKNQNIATFTQSLKAHYYLLMITQLFVSVSVFSFLFSPSSLLVFLHYFKFYFSTFPSQLFTHNIDKNSMFLLCNGLLVFVGITKSLSRSSSDDKPSSFVKDDGSQSQFSVAEASDLMLEITETEVQTSEPDEHENTAAEKVKERENFAEEEVLENMEKIIVVDEGQEKGSSIQLDELDEETEQLDVGEREQDKGSEIDYILIEEGVEEEEENVEEESSMLSTEELNKKFEDFIRKMKEDLRIEAQRQLVMV